MRAPVQFTPILHHLEKCRRTGKLAPLFVVATRSMSTREPSPRRQRCDYYCDFDDDDKVICRRRCSLHTINRKRRFSTSIPPESGTIAKTSSFATTDYGKFSDLQDLHPSSKKALSEMGLTNMMEIQYKTWHNALSGKDIVGRARTGTGKTIAFLLPSIQRLLMDTEISHDQKRATGMVPGKINMLIISPTRELARQISTEARRLLVYHQEQDEDRQISSQVMYGGVPKYFDIQRLEEKIPTILVATPGRLLDHIQSTTIQMAPKPTQVHQNAGTNSETQSQSFRDLLSGVQILVLDEMDSLLDLGFRDTIREILNHIPKENRQTLLYSATTSNAVQKMIRHCVNKNPDDVVFVDCVDEEDPNTFTHSSIQQSFVVLPRDEVVWKTVRVIRQLSNNPRHKILVFFPTTAQVVFFARLFQHGLGMSVLEMHAQLSQGRRSVVSDRFRHARGKAVLLTTDVSARGVDYPNVTHVVQVGVPPNAQTYLHRLGRTGRAGRQGQGILLLTESEIPFLHNDLEGWKVEQHEQLQHLVERPLDRLTESDRMRVTSQLLDGQWPQMKEIINDVYNALLGYYTSRIRSWSGKDKWEDEVVALGTEYCRQAGLNEMPRLNSRLAHQLGLHDHPGVVLNDRWESGRSFFDVTLTKVPQKLDSVSMENDNIVSAESLHKGQSSKRKGRSTNPGGGLWEEEFDT